MAAGYIRSLSLNTTWAGLFPLLDFENDSGAFQSLFPFHSFLGLS